MLMNDNAPRLIPLTAVIALEEPARAKANNAELALQYIEEILLKLKNDGAVSAKKADAAGISFRHWPSRLAI